MFVQIYTTTAMQLQLHAYIQHSIIMRLDSASNVLTRLSTVGLYGLYEQYRITVDSEERKQT